MWQVVANKRSKHIYIKQREGDIIRAVAMIPTGMINNTEKAMKDAELMAQAPQMAELLAEINQEGYVSYSLQTKINALLEGDVSGD